MELLILGKYLEHFNLYRYIGPVFNDSQKTYDILLMQRTTMTDTPTAEDNLELYEFPVQTAAGRMRRKSHPNIPKKCKRIQIHEYVTKEDMKRFCPEARKIVYALRRKAKAAASKAAAAKPNKTK